MVIKSDVGKPLLRLRGFCQEKNRSPENFYPRDKNFAVSIRPAAECK